MKRTDKEYRIDIVCKLDGSIDSHYTDNLIPMINRLEHRYGIKVNCNDHYIWTLEYTVYEMRCYRDNVAMDSDEIDEIAFEYEKKRASRF